jgi:protein HIRA/HIR1
VVAAAGTPAFTALATADGCLLLYTPAGRRMAPPLRLGAGVALLAAAGGDAPGAASRVLALTTAGRLKLLDALELREVMEADVTPLLESGAAILDARLSKATGVPVVTLTDSSAYVWHEGLRVWLRVADDALASSRFAPVPLVPGQGQLAEVQAEALAGRGGDPRGAPRLGGASAEAVLARGVAEGNLAAAQALGSAGEYRAWLITYARALANDGDEPRLRELADSLLGPPPGSGDGAWAPTVLGLGKRRLLREVVLVEAARNRALGGLLQRCRQALDEVEAAEAVTSAHLQKPAF